MQSCFILVTCALPFHSGAELTLTTVAQIRDALLAGLKSGMYGAFVLLIGTDTLEEAAFLLHLMLAATLRPAGRALVITGRECLRFQLSMPAYRRLAWLSFDAC